MSSTSTPRRAGIFISRAMTVCSSSYYRTANGSVGQQIGAQSRALVFLFMTQDALDRFRASKGWSVGTDASMAVAKAGANGAIEVSSADASTIGFVTTNAG